MAFDVASVKQDLVGRFIAPPFSLDFDDDYIPTGGAFNATAPLTTYIAFAYKLNQLNSMIEQLPKWASDDRYEIHAKVDGNPTKDQMRLMMQSLLAERFKLTIHFETRDVPVLVMERIHPEKLASGIRMHADGPDCSVIAPRSSGPEAAASIDMLPCNTYTAYNLPDHEMLAGTRNTTAAQMAAFLSNVGHFGKPVVDRTNLKGSIDFAVTFVRDQVAAPGAETVHGENLLEAIKDQLGLRLVAQKLSLQIPVVDHVEKPSDN